jgi:hypothetical protein
VNQPKMICQSCNILIFTYPSSITDLLAHFLPLKSHQGVEYPAGNTHHPGRHGLESCHLRWALQTIMSLMSASQLYVPGLSQGELNAGA